MPSRTRKFRGSRTHGRGQKAGRGAGFMGGRGNTGLHKHKYMSVLKYDPEHFGRKGFKRPQKVVKEEKTVNLYEIEKLDTKNIDNVLTLDLSALGYDKLLGVGKIKKPMKVMVHKASKNAVEKVKEAKGEIVLV
ncbi:MAG: 50S ribosomal protein L15 [Euryarchaeota archaeon CG01_land_8_20_14_3_00_38_12]|nr:MAG: 50S ribosomal protein L15 [Euryarchaeota archaeon CG01_land_8_20_14_3_00_38_12]PJB21809.1 MAG: 50S ribosomal protein L15 [Euryarchaeota archaeon CG_4_9_14_3_um_filter_38_12]